VITRKVQRTCATEVVLDGTGIRKELPLDKAVEIEFTPTRSSDQVRLRHGHGGRRAAGRVNRWATRP
jgi:hypothetical protein